MIVWAVTAVAGTWDQVNERRSDDPFVPPDPEQRIAWTALTADLVRHAPAGHAPPDLEKRAAALGMEILDAPDGFVVLADRAGGLRGAGLFAVRLGALDAELVLQAPHPFYDRGTGEIAGALFDGGRIRALAVATANRKAAPGSDPSHAPAGWFQAATDGMAEGIPDPLFVQLHGYAATTSDACAVVSEGATHLPPATLAAHVGTVAQALGCDDVRTGVDVPNLAARRNAQGMLLTDRAAFLHLEMAAGVREQLRTDVATRTRLEDALHALAGAGAETGRVRLWSEPVAVEGGWLPLPAGAPALLEVQPAGTAVDVSDRGTSVALRGTPDGFVVPAAGRGRMLEVATTEDVELTVRTLDDRGTAASWERWRKGVAHDKDPVDPPAGGERLRAAVALRGNAVESPSLRRLGALHDVVRVVSTADPAFRDGVVRDLPAEVRGPAVVVVGVQPETIDGAQRQPPRRLGRVTVRLQIDGATVATHAIASTGAVPVTLREWLPPGRHRVGVLVDGDPAHATFEVRRARGLVGAGYRARASTEVEIAERAFLVGDPNALTAFRPLIDEPGATGELARARVVALSPDLVEVAALAAIRSGTSPEGIEVLASAVLTRADDLDPELVRAVIVSARDPDPVAVARWLDGPVPGLRPAGVALLDTAPDVPAGRSTRIDSIRERSLATRVRRLPPVEPGADVVFGDAPGIPRVNIGAGDQTNLAIAPRADGRVPVVRLLADGPAEWRFDGTARATPGGRVDVAVAPGIHHLEVTSGTLLVLDPEIAPDNAPRVWEWTMSPLPATFALPDPGVAAELVVDVVPPIEIIAELDDGHVERIRPLPGTSRAVLRAGARAQQLTLTGPEGTQVSVSLRGRLVEEADAQPLPDLPLEEALARMEENSRRLDRGDVAARADRARLLAAVGAIEAARRDLMQLDPSDPVRAEIVRSILAGLPARRAPGPASAEAALAEVGACVPLPVGPPDTRARAIESLAASHSHPVVLAAAAEAWLEAGDAVRAVDLAMQSGRAELVERSLAALTWTTVPSADRSAGLVAVAVRPDPDAGSFHQRVRSALLASPWPAEETLVVRGNAIDVVRVRGTVRVELFCRDERGGGEPCRVPIRSGSTRRTVEVADGEITDLALDARDLEIGGPGPEHAIVVRLERNGGLFPPHAERLAIRVTRGTPARVRLAGGQVLRVDVVSGQATAQVGATTASGSTGDSIRLPVVDRAPVDLTVEGDAVVLLYTGTTAPWVLAEGWTGLPAIAYGGRAELGTRWRDGRVWIALEGGHAIDPTPAGHVAAVGALDQDVPLSSDVRLRGSIDAYVGDWSADPGEAVDPRAWSGFLAARPAGVTLGAAAIATPTRDLRLDLGGRVTGHDGAMPDRVGPYASARWLLGTTTVLSAGGTVQWRFANSLRDDAYIRPTIDLGADHARWLPNGNRAGIVARVTVLPLLAAVEGSLAVRWELTGRRGLRDLPPYEEPFRPLREWPR